MDAGPAYSYLDLSDPRLDRLLDGVVVDEDGALRLAHVPGDAEEVSPHLDLAESLAGPAGIGVDEDDNLYIADPARHRVLRVDPCGGPAALLECLSGPGSGPGQLAQPRGLVAGPRRALYVADSGNHRIQVVDLDTLQLRGIWGQADPYAEPRPGRTPGLLDDPWDLAADAAGFLYVVDHGNRRLQKFDADGRPIPAFARKVSRARANAPVEPTHVAAAVIEREERLLVLDRLTAPPAARLLVFRLDGSFDAALTEQWRRELTSAQPALFGQPPAGVAFGEGVLYVGDAEGRRVLTFDVAGRFLGAARHHRGRVAALRLDRLGRLLIHPGGGGAVVRLQAARFADAGTFRVGPLAAPYAPAPETRWHRLTARADLVSPGAHVRLFTYTSATADPPPLLPHDPPDSVADPSPTPQGTWRAAPTDAADLLVLSEPAPYLWIGGRLQSGEAGSPVLRRMRIEWNYDGWLGYLPAVYQRDEGSRILLERVLALFESALGDEEELIEDLPILFDPATTFDEEPPGLWLDWLAGWLAFELDQRWEEARRREAVARAFDLHGRRGTADGLRELIRLTIDAPVFVSEPASSAAIWVLDGERSALGLTTMLAAAEAQGAVLGTTATLGGSHLIADEDFGAPLFDDLAHRFCVHVYGADLPSSGARAEIARTVDREKPAHTTYHLCVVEPRLRVGLQARLGVDAIVAGPRASVRLDGGWELGRNTSLAAAAGRVGGRIGETTHVGRGTTVT